MISWSDEAIEAAHNAYWAAEESPTEINEMRAALDAAVKVQQLFYHPDGIEIAKQQARTEALEEAAKAVEAMFVFSGDETMRRTEKATILDAADVIRALKEKQG